MWWGELWVSRCFKRPEKISSGKEDYLGCSDIAQGFGGSRSA